MNDLEKAIRRQQRDADLGDIFVSIIENPLTTIVILVVAVGAFIAGANIS